jgi:hypothetical protein
VAGEVGQNCSTETYDTINLNIVEDLFLNPDNDMELTRTCGQTAPSRLQTSAVHHVSSQSAEISTCEFRFLCLAFGSKWRDPMQVDPFSLSLFSVGLW